MFPCLRHLCTSTWWPCWRRNCTNSQIFRMFSLAIDLNQKTARRESKRFGGVGKFTLNQIVISRNWFRSSFVRSPESKSAYEAANTHCGLWESQPWDTSAQPVMWDCCSNIAITLKTLARRSMSVIAACAKSWGIVAVYWQPSTYLKESRFRTNKCSCCEIAIALITPYRDGGGAAEDR